MVVHLPNEDVAKEAAVEEAVIRTKEIPLLQKMPEIQRLQLLNHPVAVGEATRDESVEAAAVVAEEEEARHRPLLA